MSTDAQMLDVLRHGLFTALWLCAPLTVVALLIGMATGALQSVLQIHDHALSFGPKLLLLLVTLACLLPWLSGELVLFARTMFTCGPWYVGQ